MGFGNLNAGRNQSIEDWGNPEDEYGMKCAELLEAQEAGIADTQCKERAKRAYSHLIENPAP